MSKILVADDEESIRKMMRMILELDGHQVLLAEDGPTGLEMFKRESPDVVFLDVRLPGMDGREVLIHIKALDPDSEVIMITGYGDMEMALECFRREASNFLTKPVSEEILSISLKRAFERMARKRILKQDTIILEALVREANVELEHAYQFRENLIENSPDAIVSIAKGGSIIIFNSAAERLLGYEKAEVVGKKNIADLYPRGQARRIMRDLRSNDYGGPGILQKRDLVVLDKYGKEIPVCISASLLYQAGQEAGSVGIFTDLREIRGLEKRLIRTLQLMDNLIENSPDAIISIVKGGSIIIFNSAAERLLGYEKAEVVGKKNIADLYPRGEARRIMRDLRSNDYGGPGILQKRDLVVMDKYGKEIPVSLSASLLYEAGQEVGSVGIFTDLREIRGLEKRLIRTLQLMDNLIENSPSATIYVRKGGEIVIFNAAAEKLTGYNKEEVIGRLDVRDLYKPGEAKQIMKDLRSNGILERDMVWLDKNRVEIPIRLHGTLLYEDGNEIGSLGIITDQRERRGLERQLLRSEKLASLGQLAAGIAHEINQPLTGILTFAHLLRKKFQDDELTHKDLAIIVRETTRISKIVQGILDFARETPMHKEPRHIDELLDQTLEIVTGQHRFFGITLNKEYDPSIPKVVVDSNMMEQVFMNIILNALDCMKGSGTLTVRTRQDYDWIEVGFVDTGYGIPEEILDKIFDPFFTTKSSTEGMGMGLGLATTYGIMKNHNGEILVSSKVGSGTTFTIRLPLEGINTNPAEGGDGIS
ncbi:MAG: PAS domain S-box protein [Desulfomonilaceae bacterium]